MLTILESLDEDGNLIFLVINKITKKTVAKFSSYDAARMYLLGK